MKKINSFALSCSMIAISGAPFWGIVGSKLFNTAKNEIVLSMILGFLISIVINILILTLFNIESDKNIIDKIKNIYGKYSKIVSFIFIILVYSLFLLTIYRFTSFISNEYLIETSKILILILIGGTCIYISYKGIETLSRVVVISFFLAISIYAFDIFGLIKYIEIKNYFPLFTTNIKDIVTSSLSFGLFFSVPNIFLQSIKKDQLADKEKFNKIFFKMNIVSFIMIFSAIVVTLGIYGSTLSGIFDYPLYSVLKRISLFSYIDSLENVSIMLWILYVINSGAMSIYTVKTSITETFNLNNKITSIILFIVTLLIPTLFLINNNFIETFEYLIIPLVVNLVLLLFIIVTLILCKKKYNKKM